jgi:hypothetical protein
MYISKGYVCDAVGCIISTLVVAGDGLNMWWAGSRR